LEGNNLGSEGAKFIAKALKNENNKVENINLVDGIDPEREKVIKEAIEEIRKSGRKIEVTWY
jgi:hypothetical protein